MTRSTPAPAGLRALFTGGTATGSTDGQLLERFRSSAELPDPAAEAAFAALVDRHAAMVWGVCRRGLSDRADAEDAFQATFLVLVRKAGSVRVDDRGSAGRWLYGVARKVASRQRQAAARRPAAAVETASGDDPALVAERREACAAVSAELDRLPPKYRRPIELCDFEGLTYEQAALSLGWPTATIKSRLARGRQRLKGRLARRGLAPLAAAVAAELARECRAGVSQAVLSSTPRVATAASGLVPAAVARLAEGATQAMMWNKIRASILFSAGVVGAATFAVATPFQVAAPRSDADPPAAAAPKPEEASATPFTKKLADGTIVEVVAISSSFSGRGSWWSPDGTPLDSPPCDPIPNFGGAPAPAAGAVSEEKSVERGVLIRVTNRPNDAVDFLMSFGRGLGMGNHVMREDRIVPGLSRLAGRFPKDQAVASVSFRETRGPWKTMARWGQGDGSIADHEGSRFIFSGAIATRAGTAVSLTHDLKYDVPFRLIAVDRNGLAHAGRPWGGGMVQSFSQLSLEFDVPPDQIEKYHLQTHRFGVVTIPDIALRPRKPEDPR